MATVTYGLAETLEYNGSRWDQNTDTVEQLCGIPAGNVHCKVAFIKTADLHAPTPPEPWQRLSKAFDIPPAFWLDLCQEATGYFWAGSAKATGDHEDGAESLLTAFRFLSKSVKVSSNPGYAHQSQKTIYEWEKLGFFSWWRQDGPSVMLCFDLPERAHEHIRQSIRQIDPSHPHRSPFWLHDIVLAAVVDTFDRAVWAGRDLVRNLEKQRPSLENPKADYILMHEIARHTIQFPEIVGMASSVVDSIIAEHRNCMPIHSASSRTEAITANSIERSLLYHKSLLHCVHRRSQGIESRLRSEINLAFNINAQYDSAIAARIAEASQRESMATRTISVLGLLFLPGTFLSAVFSMSFFNYQPATGDEPEAWTVSDKFYIYWAITVPVTLIILGLWTIWQISLDRKTHGLGGKSVTPAHQAVLLSTLGKNDNSR